jgi:predicted dehydrogenase
MGTKTLRGGMIGAGAWSDVQLNAWSGVPDARIVALTDRHPERLEPIIEKWKIPQSFDDFERMLDEAQLDFVDICTRPYSHAKLIKLAAGRGIPILCQKPFCQNLAEAREAVDYCRQRGVPLMINENFRWQDWHRKLKELLDLGAAGRPFLAAMHQRHRLTLPHFDHSQGYFADMPQLLLYEVGTHLLDVSRFLFGEPETVYARLHHISPEVQGEDVQVITLGYPQLSVVIYDSWASVPDPDFDRPADQRRWYPRRFDIDGTLGTLSLRIDGSIHLFSDDGRQTWKCPPDSMQRSHVAGQQHFIDCLINKSEFETSGEDNLKTMALVYACYRSAEQDRAIRAEELLADTL